MKRTVVLLLITFASVICAQCTSGKCGTPVFSTQCGRRQNTSTKISGCTNGRCSSGKCRRKSCRKTISDDDIEPAAKQQKTLSAQEKWNDVVRRIDEKDRRRCGL